MHRKNIGLGHALTGIVAGQRQAPTGSTQVLTSGLIRLSRPVQAERRTCAPSRYLRADACPQHRADRPRLAGARRSVTRAAAQLPDAVRDGGHDGAAHRVLPAGHVNNALREWSRTSAPTSRTGHGVLGCQMRSTLCCRTGGGQRCLSRVRGALRSSYLQQTARSSWHREGSHRCLGPGLAGRRLVARRMRRPADRPRTRWFPARA